MFLKSGVQKLERTVKDAERLAKAKAKALEAKRKRDEKWGVDGGAPAPDAPPGSFFEDQEKAHRELKASLGARGTCNLKTYATPAAFREALADGSETIQSPVRVRGALGAASGSDSKPNALRRLQAHFTAERLLGDAHKDVRLEYLNPVLAKLQMQGQSNPEGGQTMEARARANGVASKLATRPIFSRFFCNSIPPHILCRQVGIPTQVDFAQYFRACWNLKKMPGSDTEHCTQVVPADKLERPGGKDATTDAALPTTLELLNATGVGALSLLPRLRAARRSFRGTPDHKRKRCVCTATAWIPHCR